jgi:type II restriction/modification system DNA methylase subunit YeeA
MEHLTAQDFVTKWRKTDLSERSAVQQHFLDLCRLVGHEAPADFDPTGKEFTFEMGTEKSTGGQGWADVAKIHYFGWEYKGKHADLDKAYQQLLQYRESLQNPPLLVVSDTERIIIHTNFTDTPKKVVELTLDDLLTGDGLRTLRAVFFEPNSFRPQLTTQQVTQKAAEEFSRLAALLQKYGAEPQKAAHFLIRLLFCLFAEDIGLLPAGIIKRLVDQTRRRPKDFSEGLGQLFGKMAKGGLFGADRIVQFNGGLFDDDTVLDLDSDGLDILARVDRLDWSSIEPSIFGTLFERGLDPSKRSQIGAHFTGKDDIVLIVEPVLMWPLRARWETIKAEAVALADERDQAKGQRRTNLDRQLRDLLIGFATELAKVRVLDPACGSGNFLYIALRLLLDLWKDVSTRLSEYGFPRLIPSPDVAPSPAQLHGIEINGYAYELAQSTIWIGYVQWLQDNGFGFPPEPILRPLVTIQHMDAILAYDAEGKPVEPEWPAADVVVGNPPFLGDKKMRAEMGSGYVEALRQLYNGRVPGGADLVCYWFEKARAQLASGDLKRAGLLATQGIRGGANRVVLNRIKETGDIFWAQSDRDWVLDGAAVNVSMVGFDAGIQSMRELDGRSVLAINADLTASADLTSAMPLTENFGLAFIGTQKGGPFDISSTVAAEMIRQQGNPNGRSNSDVVRTWINGSDLTGRPRNMWVIDFGSSMPIEEAAKFEAPFEYVKKHVYPVREHLRRENHRKYWWIHAESRPGMRMALRTLGRYIATPRVSKHRLFVWQPAKTLTDSAAVVIARDDDYFLGMLQSRPHEIWALRKGTALEDRPRYTPTSTFDTFPFPFPPGHEPQDDPGVRAIAEAAAELVKLRDAWLNPPGTSEADLKKRTLTNLYNQRPTWLDNAHRRLDEAVFEAYGWPVDLSEDEILARLLALNLDRAARQGEVVTGEVAREDGENGGDVGRTTPDG